MNADVLTQLQTDVANLVDWANDTFAWNSQSYGCIASKVTSADIAGDVGAGSLYSGLAAKAVLKAADFPTTRPEPGQTATLNGKNLKIERVLDGGPTITVILSHIVS